MTPSRTKAQTPVKHPRPVIIDTDPGIDDAVAILLALASPELEVRGITAVAGNVPLAHAEANARRICELAGRPDIPVFAGRACPLLRDRVTAEETHGAHGLGRLALPAPSMPLQSLHGVTWMVETLARAAPASVTLCALGPLTNLAAAFQVEPRIRAGIREIVVMGGGFAAANVTPHAEFNIHADPHAAEIVLAAGCPLTLVPLDLTWQALATRDRIARIAALGTPVACAVATMLDFYADSAAVDRLEGGPMHDPCVIARLLRPTLFDAAPARVRVETRSAAEMGRTTVASGAPNATVLRTVDAVGFFDLLVERLAGLRAQDWRG